MTGSRKRTFVLCSALALSLVVGAGVAPAQADLDPPAGYPTWDDVNNAMQSESSKKAEADRVSQALTRAQAAATTAAQAAVDAKGVADAAQRDLDAAIARGNTIQAQLQTARENAATSQLSFGKIANARQKETGQKSAEVFVAKDPSAFMQDLMLQDRVSKVLQSDFDTAAAAASQVKSLSAQADAATKERASLETAAKEKADAAQDASSKADAEVASTKKTTDILYAQLAKLTDSTAQVQQKYRLGQKMAEEAAELQRQREEAARKAAEAAAEAERQREAAEDNSSSYTPPANSGGGGGGGITDPGAAQSYARGAIGAYGWGGDQFDCLVNLWNGESGWRYDALNPSSGAYGIPQSWPASKLGDAGADWRTNAATQVDWGLSYISSAYGSPCQAWYSWNSRWPHWY